MTTHPAETVSERRPVSSSLPALLGRGLTNWRERHRLASNFWLHMIGIPMAVLSLPLWLLGQEMVAAAAFAGGYFLQYIGHRLEGNDLGEWAGIKRLLGLPYVGIAPRWLPPAGPSGA